MQQSVTKGTPDFRSFLKILQENRNFDYFDLPINGEEIGRTASINCKQNRNAIYINSPIPMVLNIYASKERLETALGNTIEKVSKSAWEYIKSKPKINLSFSDAPKFTKIRLTDLPLIKYHKKDVSGSINFGCVISESEGIHNCGIYRVQPLSDDEAVIHCYPSSGLGQLLKNSEKDIPVTIAIGCNANLLFAAGAKLPNEIDELLLASCLDTELTFIKTNNYPVPSDTQIVIQGQVSVKEKKTEGPFFIYTNDYSKPEPFPVLKIDSVSIAEKGIYLSTVTGTPPMENAYLGQACGEIHKHRIIEKFPDIKDVVLPLDKVFRLEAHFILKKDIPQLNEFLKRDYFYKSFRKISLFKDE
jgi:4-hydroxy-3-polyprenylbenzoate decarboxylase